MATATPFLVPPPPHAGTTDEFSGTLRRLLSLIGTWVRSQKTRVSEGYLIPEPDGLMLYAVGREEAYDFELGDELSEFSVRLEDQGLQVGTTLLPAGTAEELAAFFDPLRGTVIRIPVE